MVFMSNYKYNFQHYDYTKRGYLSFQTKKVEALINEGKYNLAKNILKNVLDLYPSDRIALMQWAQILILERNYQQAKEVLESIPKEKCYINLVALYEKLGEWDKIKFLYDNFFNDSIDDNKKYYREQKIYLSGIFGDPLPVENPTYIDLQLYDYSDERAISHIRKNHSNNSDSNRSLFGGDVNIEELFYKVKDYIRLHPERGIINNGLLETFMFYYPECGTGINSGLYNTFSVRNIIAKDKIITMFPHNIDNANYDVCYFETSQSKHPVKVKSGIERFNSKYKKD